ncbi:hypothetical protein [Alicycliphilus denitrificans]
MTNPFSGDGLWEVGVHGPGRRVISVHGVTVLSIELDINNVLID